MIASCCAAQEEGTIEETTVHPLEAISAKEPSAAPQEALELAIDTTLGPLGLVVDARGATLMVTAVSSGLLSRYNEAAEATKQVQPGDFILDIDGKTEPEAMMKELLVIGSHHLKVQRPVILKVAVKKDGKSVGLTLAYVATSPSMAVTGILDGAVQEHNKTAPADTQIKVGDRIMAVGPVAGEAGKMVEALKAADTIEFTIARVSP